MLEKLKKKKTICKELENSEYTGMQVQLGWQDNWYTEYFP